MNRPRYHQILLIIIFLGLILPFIDKPVHIDDPLFLWTARHILDHPVDFYGFTVNWFGQEMPMYEVMQNPPLLSYYLAGVGKLWGWAEVTLHLSLLIPAIFLILGIYALASQFSKQPFWAALAAITAPVFLITSTTLMCETFMLCFWVWAVVFWRRGLQENNPFFLGGAALLITLSALSKYYGISLIPLLFLYTLLYHRGVRRQILFLLIPVVILVGYHWFTYALYGRGLLLDAASYATEVNTPALIKLFIGLAFLGGCLLNSIFYVPLLWKRNYLLAGLFSGIIIFMILCALKEFGMAPLVNNGAYKWEIIGQATIFILAGLNIIALTLADIYEMRDADSVLLGLWVIGTCVFAFLINWSVNGRSILPLTPAVMILLWRRLERLGLGQWFQAGWQPLVIYLPAACLALMLSWADYQLAISAKSAAAEITARFQGGPGKVWFDGHWGFQYYMMAHGFAPLDARNSRLDAGDLVAMPRLDPHDDPANYPKFTLVEQLEFPSCSWLAVLNSGCGAGFYSDVYGSLPFVFTRAPREKYYIFRFSPFAGR